MPNTTRQTEGVLRSLGALQPATLAGLHGSSYIGPGDWLRHPDSGLAEMLKGDLSTRLRAGHCSTFQRVSGWRLMSSWGHFEAARLEQHT